MVPIIFAVCIAFMVVHCLVSIFDMTVNTLFVCFCEDASQNDGLSRPYYMSLKLREILMQIK